jgi:hypothetical protein
MGHLGYLVYPEQWKDDPSDDDLIDPLFVSLDTVDDEAIHHNETDFTKLASLLSKTGALLMPKKDTEQPLMRVTLLKSSQCSNGKGVLGIVVSMSHVAVDGYSYYQLYNALVNESNPKHMPKLEVTRLAESTTHKENAIGKENMVFMSPGMLASLVRGLLYDLLMWPFQKSHLKIEKSIALVDGNKIRDLKRQALANASVRTVDYVSTNDLVTSWFLSKSKSTYGFMAFNLRNRLKGHPSHLGGNYSDLLFYRTHTHRPTLIRRSLTRLTRTDTWRQPPTTWELTWGRSSFVTNWASFASGTVRLPNIRLLAHYPMVDLSSNVMPSTMAFCVIFRADADRLGILFAGAAYRMRGLLQDCPFSLEQ